jgi:2-polyprenyl-3-methyl-5-hydroxy-6-metoxy-1,4-benzoquinol methylase
MKNIIKNYEIVHDLIQTAAVPRGTSAAPKYLFPYIFDNNAENIQVLDIGFGDGSFGRMIKNTQETSHWSVDGIDGFEPNCNNPPLFDDKIYRNIWHGLAQDIPSEQYKNYDLICLLDVIEHVDAETAKWLLRTLLNSMNDNAYLFISTPLWFYPQDSIQKSDLEEHLIGIPASSMMALLPKLYSITEPLIGGFVLGKKSLDYIEFFQPTTNKNFSYEMGVEIAKAINCEYKPGFYIKMW